MVDFHSHILPAMDDGAKDVEESLALLRESAGQGVTTICATAHFNPDEEDPASFLKRRTRSGLRLQEAIRANPGTYPRILMGAEVQYFPGISTSDDIARLKIGKSACILVEPLMTEWSDFMLDEIESMGTRMQRIPVIAHVDRYMRFLNDFTLLDRLGKRRILAQVNAGFFLREDTFSIAMDSLWQGKIHLLGSDCHNMRDRAPNLGHAVERIRAFKGDEALEKLNKKAENILKPLAN